MFVAISPKTGSVLCKDNKFRSSVVFGKKGPKVYKTIGGAMRASERLGQPSDKVNGLQRVASAKSLKEYLKLS